MTDLEYYRQQIAESLDLNPENDYATKSMWRADCGLILIGLIPVVIGLIGLWVISQL